MAEFHLVIQARMGSQRFPGKVLHPLRGKPALQHLLESVLQAYSAEEICVATSTAQQDDEIEAFCRSLSLPVFRGDENNVALRFVEAAQRLQPNYLIRLNGDSPLLDYRIILQAQELARAHAADFVSTAWGKRFPSGMNVEVIKTAAFLNAYPRFSRPEHFEHVTRYIYDNPGLFQAAALDCLIPGAQDCKFTFDTAEDKLRLEKILAALDGPHYLFTVEEKCRLYHELFFAGR